MRYNFISERLVIETLQILFILSMGYPHHSGYQTNAMDTSKDSTTSSSTTATSASASSTPSSLLSTSPSSVVTGLSSAYPSVTPAIALDALSSVRITATSHPLNDSNEVHIDDIAEKHFGFAHPTTTSSSSIPTKGVNRTREFSSIISGYSTSSTMAPTLLFRSQKIALKSTATTSLSGSHSHNTSSTSKKFSAMKSDSKLTLPKPQKTDAPMLNYIFDMFSTANKHHHHDQRYGPHFEDVQREGGPTNITVQAGASVLLNCRISLLQDKTVSWVRRHSMGEDALDLLTVGLHTYTGDNRYTMEFQYPNNWRLKISNAKKEDDATYECQISTHPPRVIQINLHVNAPKVMIVDEYNDQLQEKYYETDSTLQLSCIVRNVLMTSSVVYWKHGDQILNYDTTRGGVSVKTELMEDGANSTLFIAKINKSDSGNYTCSISDFQEYGIVVHILKGESFAELHHGTGSRSTSYVSMAISAILLLGLLCLPSYIHR